MEAEGLVTILFTDVEGSTDLQVREGDEEAQRILTDHDRLVRDAVEGHGGRVIKGLGDGSLATFSSARRAIACAVAIQRSMPEGNGDGPPLRVRVGLNTGEVLGRDGDVHGAAVAAAARITSFARGGEVVVADVVRQLAGTVPGVSFVDRGTHELKGFPEPVRLFAVADRVAPPVSTASAPGAPSPTARAPFYGRERDLADLRADVDAALAGSGRLTMVAGEAGIGKTRLVEEACAYATARGAMVLWSRCWEGEGAPGFWPWTQLLRAYARSTGAASIRDALDPDEMRDLARLAPELMPDGEGDVPAPEANADGARFQLFDVLGGLILTAAGRTPLVLVLDDLHWADEPSLHLLHFIARAIHDAPVMVVATYRDTDLGNAPLAGMLGELSRDCRHVTLEGLDPQDVGKLVADVAGEPPSTRIVDAIVGQTDGNPFFVREVTRLLAAPSGLPDVPPSDSAIPEGVRAVVERRLGRLSDTCNRLLGLAAVAGHSFGVDLLARAGGGDRADIFDLVEEAVDARVLHAEAGIGRYRFTHAIFRETIRRGLPTRTRAHLHLRIGEALEALAARGTSVAPAELATHFVESLSVGDPVRAVTYAVAAGDQALGQLAYEEAAAHFERAAEAQGFTDAPDDERGELQLRLGDARRRAGDGTGARVAFVAAASAFRHAQQPERLAEAALGYGTVWGDFAEVESVLVGMLEESLSQLTDPTPLRARLLAQLARSLYFEINASERADALSAEAVELARELGDAATLAECLAARHDTSWGPGSAALRRDLANEMVTRAGEVGDLDVALHGHAALMTAALELGDLPGFDQAHAAYESLATRSHQPRYAWYARSRRATRALMLGDYDEGRKLAAEALALGERAHEWEALGIFLGARLVVGADRGWSEEDVAGLQPLVDDPRDFAPWLAGAAVVFADAGYSDRARALVDRLGRGRLKELPTTFGWTMTMACMGAVADRLDDAELAAEVRELLEPYADSNLVLAGGVAYLGAANYWLATLDLVLGEPESALTRLDRAAAMHEQMRARPMLARTHVERARALLDRGRDEDRGTVLSELDVAERIVTEVGMARVATRIEELRARAASGQ